jgi:hypothetical protein
MRHFVGKNVKKVARMVIFNLSSKEQAIKVRKQAEKKLYGPFLKWYDEYIKNKKACFTKKKNPVRR